MIEQAAFGLEFDNEIDVALLVRLAAGYRAEHAHITGAVFGGDAQDFLAFRFKKLFNHHSPVP
jgi:hypothetical protein